MSTSKVSKCSFSTLYKFEETISSATMTAQHTSPDKAEPKKKKGEKKILHLAGKQLSYCTGNSLGTYVKSSYSNFHMLVTNLRIFKFYHFSDILFIFSIEIMQIRDIYPEIRPRYSDTNHTYLVVLIP